MAHLPLIALVVTLAAVAPAYAENPQPLLKGLAAATPSATAEPLVAAPPAAFDTAARSAILVDFATGAVLFDKNSDVRLPPASMGKMMSVYLAFALIDSGQIKLTDKVTVLPETWKKWNNQGSTMFLSPNQQVSIEDLLHGIVTLSGNDACVVLAEGIAGSEAAYATKMNELAQKIGLRSSHFANTNGWPDPDEYVTARDLATLAVATIRDHPALYQKFYPVAQYSWKPDDRQADIKQDNRNPLLGHVVGADGLKTGHTDEAGYGFTGSAERNGQRLVMVVTGLDSKAQRQAESIKLMEWGFRTFQRYKLFEAGTVIDQIPVWLGAAPKVAAVAEKTAAVSMTRFAHKDMVVKIVYDKPLKAPVKKGMPVAQLVVSAPATPTQYIPLVAKEDVASVGGFGKIGWLLNHWLLGGK